MTSIKTRLCDALNIKVPIIQAPIGAAVTPQFASAVANYGALGTLGLGTRPLAECSQTIQQTLALTDRPIAVNLILSWDQSERVALCLEQGIKIIWFFWGDPSPYILCMKSLMICLVLCNSASMLTGIDKPWCLLDI